MRPIRPGDYCYSTDYAAEYGNINDFSVLLYVGDHEQRPYFLVVYASEDSMQNTDTDDHIDLCLFDGALLHDIPVQDLNIYRRLLQSGDVYLGDPFQRGMEAKPHILQNPDSDIASLVTNVHFTAPSSFSHHDLKTINPFTDPSAVFDFMANENGLVHHISENGDIIIPNLVIGIRLLEQARDRFVSAFNGLDLSIGNIFPTANAPDISL